jgi:hypothetical protein
MKQWDDIERSNFTFSGNYRAYVEDNNDPLDCGRVRVRIVGLHSPDPFETWVGELPWAEQALPIEHSGGRNILCPSAGNFQRYFGDKPPLLPPPNENVPISKDWKDHYISGAGTGGKFSVPRKGSLVWVFFENGDHTRPHYWAMAPNTNDWNTQKDKIIYDIAQKVLISKEFKSNIIMDPIVGVGYIGSLKYTLPVEGAGLSVSSNGMGAPILNFNPIDKTIKNKDITSITSPDGSTHVTVHTEFGESHYMIHKSYIKHIDDSGNVTEMIGKLTPSYRGEIDPTALNWSSYEMCVGGNYDLFIIGDWSIKTNGNIYMETEESFGVNAAKKLEFASRLGNIDTIAVGGAINMESKTGLNFSTLTSYNLFCGRDYNCDSTNNYTNVSGKHKVSSGECYNETTGLYSLTVGDFALVSSFGLRFESTGSCDVDIAGYHATQCSNFVVLSEDDVYIDPETGEADVSTGNIFLQASSDVTLAGGLNTNITGKQLNLTGTESVSINEKVLIKEIGGVIIINTLQSPVTVTSTSVINVTSPSIVVTASSNITLNSPSLKINSTLISVN